MKTILCYGDSLTWGYNAETLDRHAFEDRWPSVLAKALGPGVAVIAEGLNGRTTAYDDHLADCDRNGARILPTILHSHDPIDLVILFLGANDMKPAICGTAFGAVQGMERLVELVRHHAWSFDAAEGPEVLIVSPPPLCETANTAFAAMFAGGVEQSAMLATLYADLADERGCGFFDAGSVAETTPLDGVHLDARNTRAIGKGLEPVARMMLGL
ncbi:SGNH/GDSL hydrolase family protein [Shinella yambaruensis]|uniref:Arylesterase n=1 Tax=Shinella yambaruensis TaxID=415996 RepID=A0ABQ5ZTQ1_9HYPH|nr:MULTISPECIES: SGNH/GDSL hydrolase family protein [Shinella]CAI0337960.1 Arylesterase [Rhizobiaceae bacterium]CAK7256426.1 Lysophospholipase L1-like esterase [Shinella sp. WSC3-e]MCJ8023770.1 SGNH/GDSL hydrolase family protein [Shinella yambaruensis]MCO5138360.1 SGNH/GDSL hydrolase family protein [Shinella sp.]MCU7979080.1 SGNH/GDSL hydrolase family protein [Shinella yambaruensis]